jgi:uncharacterized tellurite resistance protein B-like protein
MQILLGLLAVIAGIGAWYWRFKMTRQAADEITDKAEAAPVSDPAAAAVVMMIAVASADHPLSSEAETVIRDEITSTMGIADPAEILVIGKSAAAHVEDANTVSLRYAKLWCRELDRDQRLDLVRMAERVARADGSPSARQTQQIAKLHERLGLKP